VSRDPETQNCGTCAFYQANVSGCFRFPPPPAVRNTNSPQDQFPVHGPKYFCGEFRPGHWWDQWKKPEGDNVREAGQ